MLQHTLGRRNDAKPSRQQSLVKMMHWTLVAVLLLPQMTTAAAAKFKDDNCITKNQAGICKEWGECPIIKTLIDNGEYTNLEVVSCGFGIREELICCPVRRNEPPIETTSLESKISFPETTTKQGSTVRDFWLSALENTTSSTTSAGDFWLDLLNPNSTTMPATEAASTTLKPLVVGGHRLNGSSEFFDFNALLGGSKSGAGAGAGARQEARPESQATKPKINPSNEGFVIANSNNGPGNSGPANINQWSSGQNEDYSNGAQGLGNFNNGRARGNGHGNRGWAHQNNRRVAFNGQHQLNRGPHNNGRAGNHFVMPNQNSAFSFPDNHKRPNNLFGDGDAQYNGVGRPLNNMPEQHNNNNIKQINKNEQERIEDLIRKVFQTTSSTTQSSAIAQAKPGEVDLEETIANIFNVNKVQNLSLSSENPSDQPLGSRNDVVWPTPPKNHEKPEFDHGPSHTLQRQKTELDNPQVPGRFPIIPVEEHQISRNILDVPPSTNFIQQQVVLETWPMKPVHRQDYNPVQVVYENLVSSGMDIVQAHSSQMADIFNQPQQPVQVVVIQPETREFVQQSGFVEQQPVDAQNFEQLSQKLVQQPLQMESLGKQPRSTSPLQQFVSQTNNGQAINVQSPPAQILDPFKPFEFRPYPEDETTFLEVNNSLSATSGTPTPSTKTGKDRAAVRACRRIEDGLNASLSPHILDGTPAELGEFPHMAAIGYSRIGGDDSPPYDIRCGGTLIDKRFVLTAAHCVSERENVPSIVRLGVVNFTDPTQMSAAVEIRIKQTHIHDDYVTRLTYNDIAILELEREVEYSEYIYPVCLYTDEKDPDTKIKLWVTGWGTVNTTTRSFSNILLKAPLHTSPLQNCNKSFTDYGLNRRIPEGIIRTQICAEDKDQSKDACQGDSGGPLNMIIDESYKNYRLVGVVSSGFGCASSTPGLYTRVAAFLDFVEKIVWPNGAD